MGVPYFMSRLNDMARTLAAAFNEGRRLDGTSIQGVIGHFSVSGPGQTTFDLNGNAGALLLGNAGFGSNWGWDGSTTFNYFNITANNFAVNPAILSNPRMLALAGSIDKLPSHNTVVESWSDINTYRGLFREGRLGDFIASITGDLGITGRQAENFARSYDELIVTIDNQRRSVSGVSVDEEVAFMIQHQIVFQAAARLFSVIDGIYDTLINRVGRWGG
jgi:flagellar hook-associated protein 1 FlgK